MTAINDVSSFHLIKYGHVLKQTILKLRFIYISPFNNKNNKILTCRLTMHMP